MNRKIHILQPVRQLFIFSRQKHAKVYVALNRWPSYQEDKTLRITFISLKVICQLLIIPLCDE